MRKIFLTMLAVVFGVTLSYAESCSSGQGSLSYQISGCSEQSRACCSGTWCSWGTTSCASCNDTTQACSGNVSGACAGNRTRSVTGSCGSCSYSGWNDSGCSYTQSCTATSESRNCVGNVSGVCGGTQTRTRSVTGSCGSCSYSGWGNWGGSCSYTQSCTYTDAACSSISSAYNKGDASRSVTGTCGGCSYSNWDTSRCSCDGCNINGTCINPCKERGFGIYSMDCSSNWSFVCQCGYGSYNRVNVSSSNPYMYTTCVADHIFDERRNGYFHYLEDCEEEAAEGETPQSLSGIYTHGIGHWYPITEEDCNMLCEIDDENRDGQLSITGSDFECLEYKYNKWTTYYYYPWQLCRCNWSLQYD